MEIKIIPQKHTGDDKGSAITTGLEILGFTEAQYKYVIKDWLIKLTDQYPNCKIIDNADPILINVEFKTVSAVNPEFTKDSQAIQTDLEYWKTELETIVTKRKEWLELKDIMLHFNHRLEELVTNFNKLELKEDNIRKALTKKFGEKIWK